MAQVTLSEAAKRLNISKQGVLNRVKSGKLHGAQVDGRWYVQVDDVDTFHEEEPTSEVDGLRAEIGRLQLENACLRAKLDGMEAVLSAFVGGKLMVQPAPQALPDGSNTAADPAGRRRRWWQFGKR